MSTVSIIQSCYIPWKGYFDIVNSSDIFIILDSVQYTVNDWRNRNQIYTRTGPQWLTIPVQRSGHLSKRIDEVTVSDGRWAAKHLSSVLQSYARSAHIATYRDMLTGLYRQAAEETRLSAINRLFFDAISKELGITAKVIDSADIMPVEILQAMDPNERLIRLIKEVGGTCYVSGPAAKSYMDIDGMNANNIDVYWANYSEYPEYSQLTQPFNNYVSILDVLLHNGQQAAKFLKTFSQPLSSFLIPAKS